MRFPLWRQLRRGVGNLRRRARADQDVADEVQDYLERETAEQLARGLPPDEAVRAARLSLGGMTGLREAVRGYGWENGLERVVADVRYAARGLRGSPGFTLVTVLTLAVGIGGTTAIFSAVNPILFQPPPYPEAGRIRLMWESPHNPETYATYREVADRSRSFAALAALRSWQPTLTGPAEPERLEGQRVSAAYFRVLGVTPALGRDFAAEEDRLGGPHVALLSDAFWRRRFAGDPGLLGRTIRLDDDDYLVLGVLPSGFENVLAPGTELWTPLQYDMSLGQAWGHHLRTVGRLRPGVTGDQAGQEVAELTRAVAARHPEAYRPGATSVLVPLHDELVRGVRPALLAILVAVVLVLVIASVNVTNLLLARGVRRRAEFALRAALGAGRARLMRQLLSESLLLAGLGGLAGMAVAVLGVRALLAVSPAELPRAAAIRLDGPVFLFGLGLTTLIGVAFGLIPAFQAARSDPNRELQYGARGAVGGHRRTRGTLVVAEVALALVLLVGSGLLFRSLGRLFAVPAGFDAAGLLTLQVQTAGHRFQSDSSTRRFFAQALEAVRGLPRAGSAALTSQLPLSGDLDEYGAHFEAGPRAPAASYSVFRYAVSPGYFEVMGIPLRRGRWLDERDRADAPRAALISESLARQRFGAESPLGERLRLGPQSGPAYQIVGVVGDVKQQSLALEESAAVYVPADQWLFVDNAMSLVVRTGADPAALTPDIRRAIWSVDRDQPIVRAATMQDLLAISAAERRFALTLFEAFALAALLLAAAGMYGVLAGSVAERTREIGVRSALGATRGRVVALVLRQGLTLVGWGVALGLGGAVLAGRAMRALLFGISPLDLTTYASVIGLLIGVAMLACGAPALRAARVDPARTLREE